jgi:HMG (high mobility group) box
MQGPSGAAPAVPGAETKRRYRRHPKPDENAPDRPPSAYVIFSNKVREEVKDQNLSFPQIAKLVGDRWQKLDLSGKESYEAQANAAKERYNIQLSTYKTTDLYKEYMQYLADFKAKHGRAAEQKRPKLDPESSGGSVSGKSLEMANLLMPSQGHIRNGSTGSMASTAFPSPAGTQGPLTLQTQGPGMMTATRLQSVASRSESPPNPQRGSDFSRRGQASQQSSISDDPSMKRNDSDPLALTASLSLSTPPSSTPPLPPLVPSGAVSEYGFGQDISRLRFPADGLQAGTALGGPMGHQSNASYPFPQTLPSPSVSEGSWQGRGTDLRSYLDSGRSIPPPTYPTSGAPTGVISPPPLGGSDRTGDITSQRTLLLSLKRMRAAHGGEEIAEVIIDTVRQYDIVDKLGVYVADNAESNDTAWKRVLAELHPERDPVVSRSRCLGHIINLAAKAFIIGKDVEAFVAVVDQVNDSTPRESEVMKRAQDFWRKKGPVGKLHNIVVFIRSSPQRKEAFKATVVDGSKDGKLNSFISASLAQLARLRKPETLIGQPYQPCKAASYLHYIHQSIILY